MRTFTLNNVVYNAKKIDFNMICDWEDSGVSLEQIQNKPMSMIRSYIASCIGKPDAVVGQEIEKHIVGGGDFSEISEIVNKEMDESDFFRALKEKQETEVATMESKQNTKSK